MSKDTKALTVKEETVDAVATRIAKLERNGEIHFPADYSPQNALKSAWLVLQEVKNKDGKLALHACSRPSIMNSLLDMVIQGLNPAKKQGYFIAYGTQLVFQRSYFGDMTVAQRVNPSIPNHGLSYAVVYEGDELTYEIRRGSRVVVSHQQKLENIAAGKIVAAYCEIYDDKDRLLSSALMTMDQIKQSWKQSKVSPVDDKGNVKAASTHGRFSEEMALRTVIRKACKPIINSSSDRTLMEAAHRSEFIQAEEEGEAEIQENANQDVLDVEPEPEQEPEQEEAPPEEEQEQKATGTNGPEF